MKTVWVDSKTDPVVVPTRRRLLDALDAAGVPVRATCGGKGLCASCHCYVEQGGDQLSPVTKREALSIRMLHNSQPNSRLACQAKVTGDGVIVRQPEGVYIEGTGDLEGLVGRRAERPILHPVTGQILIEAGKLITRSRIEQLQTVDIDVAEMRRQSQTAN